MNICRKILFFLALLWSVPGAAAPSDGTLCRAAIDAAERQGGIPDAFLSAIGRVESGRAMPGMGVAPWPWTINAQGQGHFYATQAEAVAAAQDFLRRGIQSIDVGCLQVNLLYHSHAFPSLQAAFDPGANAAYAASFLLDMFHKTGSWPLAAAAYHSATPALGHDYQQKVLAAWAVPDPRLPYRAKSRAPEDATPDLIPPAHIAQPAKPAAAPAPMSAGFASAPPPVAAFTRTIGATSAPHGAMQAATGRSLASYRAFPVR